MESFTKIYFLTTVSKRVYYDKGCSYLWVPKWTILLNNSFNSPYSFYSLIKSVLPCRINKKIEDRNGNEESWLGGQSLRLVPGGQVS